jgi:hypothetical protein
LKISRRGAIVVSLVCLLAVIGIMVYAQNARPRLWTAAAVFKHLEAHGIRATKVNTDYAALPQDLASSPTAKCRERVVFTIAFTGGEIPYNQLFLCDRIQDVGGVNLHYINRVKTPYHMITSDEALAVLILSPETTEGAAIFIKTTFTTLGMKYVGPSE